MSQQAVDVLQSPTPSLEQSLTQEDPLANHTSVTLTDSFANTPHPADIPQEHRMNWKNRILRWICNPRLWVFVVLISVAGVSFCPALIANKKPFDLVIFDSAPTDTEGVKIRGNILHFDWMDTTKVSVAWTIGGYGKYSLEVADGYPGDIPPVNVAVDCYFNDPSKPVFSYDPAHLPLTRWNGAKLPVRSLSSFSVEHDIEFGTQYHVPNDWYTFSAFAFVIDRSTNESVPIITFEIGTAGPGDFSTTSDVVPSTSDFTYDAEDGQITAEVKSYTIFARIGRSVPTKALIYSMFTINWVLTLSSIITTFIMFDREGEIGVALLPITVILSIPAIRNLYVGSPPLGIYLDVVGFFPQMLIVVSCTMVVLFSYAVQSVRPRDAVDGKLRIGV